MSNIAEGFERRAPKQFDHFLSIAKGSCAEVRSLLYVGLDAEYVDRPTFDKLMERANEIGRILSGFRKSLDPLKSVSQNSELGTQNSGANLG